MIESGVHGMIVLGTVGENCSLEYQEKLSVLKMAVEQIRGRIPLLSGVAECTTRLACRYAADCEKIGLDGLMVLPGMVYKSDARETIAHFRSVAKSSGLPIMIYNNPVDYKIEVTIDMFEELAKVPNIQAVKESTRDVTNVTRMRNKFKDRFSILCGVDTLALEELLLGADGWVAGLVCAFPAETVAVYKLAKAGKIAEATEIYRWFMPLLELDIHPKLVQYIKLAEAKTGIGSEIVRKPRLILEGEERKRIENIIDTGIKNRPVLPEFHTL